MALIALNFAVFALQTWMEHHSKFPFDQSFALSLDGLRHGRWWQLVTFQLLHAPLAYPLSWQTFVRLDLPWHLLLNCWGIFVFGPPLEAALGKARLAATYFLSGVAGGALQVFASALSDARFGGPVVGASAGVFGLVAAFTQLFPEARMTVLLFFVIPVRMTANRMLTVAAVITVVGMVFPNWLLGAHVAHAAHLGGLIAGLVFIRLFMRRFRA
jgi:membrane associated rhomboid family serine protease